MTDADKPVMDYFAQRQVARQWRPFLAALSAELFEGLTPDQAAGFLRQVGRRMAASLPLAPVGTLELLEEEANKALADLDWGMARFTAGDSEVTITHMAFPYRLDGVDARHWTRAFAAVTEGLYTGWMQGQGAGEGLAAWVVDRPELGTLDLRFRRL